MALWKRDTVSCPRTMGTMGEDTGHSHNQAAGVTKEYLMVVDTRLFFMWAEGGVFS